MKEKIEIFAEKCIQALKSTLDNEAIEITQEEVERNKNDGCINFISYKVKDIDIGVFEDQVDFSGDYIFRSFELAEFDNNEGELINEFAKHCAYFVKFPEMRDKPTIHSLRRTMIWLLERLDVHICHPIERYEKERQALIRKGILKDHN